MRVTIIGAGVAGLQAIATAKRLGAVVEAYDVRGATREQVKSLGAKFVDTGVSAEGSGGYARELSPDEREAQQEELSAHIARHDVVITTAQVPGRRPPLLVTEDAVKAMSPGSVIVDMGASALGGSGTTSKSTRSVSRCAQNSACWCRSRVSRPWSTALASASPACDDSVTWMARYGPALIDADNRTPSRFVSRCSRTPYA